MKGFIITPEQLERLECSSLNVEGIALTSSTMSDEDRVRLMIQVVAISKVYDEIYSEGDIDELS